MESTTRPHILVVDDEPDIEALFRQKFRRDIRKGDLVFEFARNGQEALAMLEAKSDIGIVFTDLNMPEMDGLELLSRIQQIDDRLIKPLVISAYGDMDNIRRAMNAGALDFIIKPIDLQDLATTLEKARQEWLSAKAGTDAAAALEEAERQHRITEEAKRLQKEFFDNVTHELRTPLTLLLGPLENALDQPERDAILREIETARKHGDVLLTLIDELLEVARIDAGALQLQPLQADLVGFLQDLTESFQPLARTRQINLQFRHEPDRLNMDFDPPKLRRAISNLLSNALKFTPQGGQVSMALDDSASDQAQITVRDNGPGIPEGDLSHVFARFYRASEGKGNRQRGTGIGLALVQELVGLHGGTIAARSEAGAIFEVTLPIRRETAPGDPGTAWVTETVRDDSEKQHLLQHSEYAASPEELEDPDLPLILLVEDHLEMRHHIRQSLGAGFRLREAENGAAGWTLAQEEIPDLIVSDVMMPEMDGHELLQKLRADRSTSHIPVILLTARAQPDNRVEGLEIGADAYLTKPFRREELQATVHNLLRTRDRLRERFRDEFLLHPPEKQNLSMEEQFLQSVHRIIEQELANEKLSVEDIADQLGMSRKTLHRKLKAITGQSPNQFVRRYRLESAMQMLRDKTGPIGEVAYLTGFNSHSYFSKCFIDYFRISPSDVE